MIRAALVGCRTPNGITDIDMETHNKCFGVWYRFEMEMRL